MDVTVRTAATGAGAYWDQPEAALQRSTGHLLRRAVQAYTALWASTVSDRLTSPQFAVLTILAVEPALGQQTIGARAGLDKSTCGQVVDHLGKAGLINATIDPANRRRKLVAITERGREALQAAIPLRAQVETVALAALSDDERRELNRLLGKMTGLTTPDSAAT
jgi:DNA-binding MarR family transcriptional regulator